jgi:trk system potassium uptake protein TrkA
LAKPKQVLVIGLGRFGRAVAATLSTLGHDVLGVDRDDEAIQSLAPQLAGVMALDASNQRALAQLPIREFDVCVVAIGSAIQASILATSNLSELNAREVVAKAMTDEHARILSRVGAHRVLFPEREMGERLANALAGTNLIDFFELDPEYAIAEVRAPARVAGKTLRDANVRGHYGVIVLCVKSGAEIDVIPDAARAIAANDVLVVAGPTEAVERMSRR